MADLTTLLREQIAANLAAITGCQVSPWALSSPHLPALQVVAVDEIEYDITFGSSEATWTFVIHGFAGSINEEGAQRTLAGWCSPTGAQSVRAAVRTDRTLGGNCDDLRVTRYTGDKVFTIDNSVAVQGGEWLVQVET